MRIPLLLSSTHCASASQPIDPGSNPTIVYHFLRTPCLRAVDRRLNMVFRGSVGVELIYRYRLHSWLVQFLGSCGLGVTQRVANSVYPIRGWNRRIVLSVSSNWTRRLIMSAVEAHTRQSLPVSRLSKTFTPLIRTFTQLKLLKMVPPRSLSRAIRTKLVGCLCILF